MERDAWRGERRDSAEVTDPRRLGAAYYRGRHPKCSRGSGEISERLALPLNRAGDENKAASRRVAEGESGGHGTDRVPRDCPDFFWQEAKKWDCPFPGTR